jgi:hypothetical protein
MKADPATARRRAPIKYTRLNQLHKYASEACGTLHESNLIHVIDHPA